jgi:hypothetical protein
MLERVMGIEPTYSAWKAAALPLSYTRLMRRLLAHLPTFRKAVDPMRVAPSTGPNFSDNLWAFCLSVNIQRLHSEITEIKTVLIL